MPDEESNTAEMLLYGEISEYSWYGDEITPSIFNQELKDLGAVDEITVRINSGGGDIFAAVAIYTRLKEHKAKISVKIDGWCASAATIIAMAGDTIEISVGGVFMIHDQPAYAVILLLTENANSLLPTICSRCVMLKLRNIKDQLVKRYLMEQLQVPDYKADVCTAFAQGNIGKAAMLAGSEHFNEIKDEAVRLLKNIDTMELGDLVEAVKRISAYKIEITDYLDILMIWYRDVLIYKATMNIDRLIFGEEIDSIRERAKKSSYEGIETILEALEKAKARLRANVNFDLVMELLLLTIKEN